MASPTQVLSSAYLKSPATPATQCFLCHNYSYYQKKCLFYQCPHCWEMAPGHPSHLCMWSQCTFVSVGAIPIRHVLNDCMQIVINQVTFQLIVHIWTCPLNRQLLSLGTEHLCDPLREELVVLMPEAWVYERGNVIINYLNKSAFLLCVSHCTFFPLELTTFTKDHYMLHLGPCSVCLMPYPANTHIHVPFLLFPFWVRHASLFLIITMSSSDPDCYLDFHGQHLLL